MCGSDFLGLGAQVFLLRGFCSLGFGVCKANVGALIMLIGLWGLLYYNSSTIWEFPKIGDPTIVP